MEEILKGNFKVKRPLQNPLKNKAIKKETLAQTLKKKAMAHLGGSMVYVERDRLNWDGE